MKLLGTLALATAAAVLVFLQLRTVEYRNTGTVHDDGWWWVSGVKGEGGPLRLPDEIAGFARVGNDVRATSVWNRDLRVGYEVFELSDAGVSRGRRRVGALPYFVVIGAVASAPMVAWAIVFLFVALRRRPTPV